MHSASGGSITCAESLSCCRCMKRISRLRRGIFKQLSYLIVRVSKYILHAVQVLSYVFRCVTTPRGATRTGQRDKSHLGFRGYEISHPEAPLGCVGKFGCPASWPVVASCAPLRFWNRNRSHLRSELSEVRHPTHDVASNTQSPFGHPHKHLFSTRVACSTVSTTSVERNLTYVPAV